jgi:hypothetical protein
MLMEKRNALYQSDQDKIDNDEKDKSDKVDALVKHKAVSCD